MKHFNDIGFLSSDIDQWERNIRNEFSAEVELAEKVNRLAMRIIFTLPTESITDEKAMGAASFGRATQSFQIAFQLALRGAMCESRAVARLCIEAVIAMGALEKVPGTVKAFQRDYDQHRRALSNAILEGLDGEKPDEREANRLKAVLLEIETTHGSEKIKGVNWSSLAHQAGLKGLYDIGYRLFSGDAAHIGLGSLNRHVIADQNQQLIGFKFHPEKTEFKSTLFAATAAMLHLFAISVSWFNIQEYSDEIGALTANWKAVG